MSHTPTSSDYIRMLSTRGLRLIIKEHKDLHNNEQDAVFALTGYFRRQCDALRIVQSNVLILTINRAKTLPLWALLKIYCNVIS